MRVLFLKSHFLLQTFIYHSLLGHYDSRKTAKKGSNPDCRAEIWYGPITVSKELWAEGRTGRSQKQCTMGIVIFMCWIAKNNKEWRGRITKPCLNRAEFFHMDVCRLLEIKRISGHWHQLINYRTKKKVKRRTQVNTAGLRKIHVLFLITHFAYTDFSQSRHTGAYIRHGYAGENFWGPRLLNILHTLPDQISTITLWGGCWVYPQFNRGGNKLNCTSPCHAEFEGHVTATQKEMSLW